MDSAETIVARTMQWVSIESPTRHVAGVNAVLDAVAEQVASTGVGLERAPGHDGLGDILVLRAGPRTSAPSTLILSHVDTVHPIGTLASGLPCRIEGDRLYGPGVYDMKGGACLALSAFLDVAVAGMAAGPVTYVFTPDEEIGSPTSRALIEAEARGARRVLVTEPGRDGGKVVTGRKGVGRFDVVVEGRPAHSGTRHQDGRSAIREAARQILAIEAMTDYARGITTTVGLVSGGTAANVVPQWARFAVDLRAVDAASAEERCAAILALAPTDPDVRISVQGGMNRPPWPRSEGDAALYRLAEAHARDFAMPFGEVPLTGGGSDGNFTAALGVPTLDGLGIDGDGAHTLQEYGLISSIAPRAELMRRLLASR